MYPDKQTDLLETIFKVFLNACIVSKTELKPFQQTESAGNKNPELAKRAKKRSAVSLACKHKVFDSRQLSLFDDGGASI
jgi:hypothetical protein